MTEARYSVPEMHCGACESSIRRALRAVPGIAQVEVDLAGKRVSVRFEDGLTSAAAIRERIEDAGFDAAPVP